MKSFCPLSAPVLNVQTLGENSVWVVALHRKAQVVNVVLLNKARMSLMVLIPESVIDIFFSIGTLCFYTWLYSEPILTLAHFSPQVIIVLHRSSDLATDAKAIANPH